MNQQGCMVWVGTGSRSPLTPLAPRPARLHTSVAGRPNRRRRWSARFWVRRSLEVTLPDSPLSRACEHDHVA